MQAPAAEVWSMERAAMDIEPFPQSSRIKTGSIPIERA